MLVAARYGLAAAAALLIGMTQPVAADGLPSAGYGGSIKDVPAPPVFNWSGFYIGGHLGGAWANPEGDLGCRSLTRLVGRQGDLNEPHLDCSE